jgi:hypothetical protein
MKYRIIELRKMMELSCNLYTSDINILTDIINFIREEKATIISKKWGDDYKNNNPHYPLDLLNNEIYRCAEGDLSITFCLNKKGVECYIKIYNKSSYNRLKLSIRLILPNIFLRNIKKDLLRNFDYYLEEQHRIYLKEQKELWKLNYKDKLLNEINNT